MPPPTPLYFGFSAKVRVESCSTPQIPRQLGTQLNWTEARQAERAQTGASMLPCSATLYYSGIFTLGAIAVLLANLNVPFGASDHPALPQVQVGGAAVGYIDGRIRVRT